MWEILKIYFLRGKDNMQTGEKIKKYRKQKNISQEELGVLVGRSSNVISDYERCIKTPNYETLRKLANALDTTVPKLRGICLENEEVAEEILKDIISDYGKEFVDKILKQN